MASVTTPELITAARDRDFEKVRTLLNAGAKVNDTDTEGYSALYLAVRNNDFGMAEFLIMHGADANIAPLGKGRTPLMIAAKNGNKEMVTLLLDNSAQIDSQYSSGRTALMSAIEKGNLQIAELLIMRDADVSCKDDSGYTALHLAVHKTMRASRSALNTSKYLEIIEALLERGADVNIKTNDGELPIKNASLCSTKVRKKIEELFNKPRKSARDRP